MIDLAMQANYTDAGQVFQDPPVSSVRLVPRVAELFREWGGYYNWVDPIDCWTGLPRPGHPCREPRRPSVTQLWLPARVTMCSPESGRPTGKHKSRSRF